MLRAVGSLREMSRLLRCILEDRGLPVGTVSTYKDGSEWIKTRDGWVPNSGSRSSTKKPTTKTASKKPAASKASEAPSKPETPPENTHEWQVPRRKPESFDPEVLEKDEQLRQKALRGVQRGKNGVDFTPEAQDAIRERFDATISQYGIKQKSFLPQGNRLHVVNDLPADHPIQGVAWANPDSGKVSITGPVAEGLAASLSKAPQQHESPSMNRQGPNSFDIRDKVKDPVNAYHTLAHESLHNHGPHVEYQGAGAAIEEMVTELAARRITADVHGLDQRQMGFAYNGEINTTIGNLNQFMDYEDCYRAAEEGALALKRHDSDARLTGREAAEIFAEAALSLFDKNAPGNSDRLVQMMLAPYKKPADRDL